MNTKMIVKTLGLAAMMAVSAGTLANGWDTPRYGTGDNNRCSQPAPTSTPVAIPAPVIVPASVSSFHTHPAFQDSVRMMAEVDDRQDRQLDRILDGLYYKRLNPFEFRKLMDEQRSIRGMERQALSDGLMTRAEFQKLMTLLDTASRNIMIEMRDRDGRPGFGGGYGGWNHDSYNHGWNR